MPRVYRRGPLALAAALRDVEVATVALDPGAPYRTFWERFAASFIDGALLMPVGISTSLVIGYGPAPMAIAWVLVASPIPLIYTAYCHGRWGRTVGKHATGLRVVRVDDEQPIRYRQAVRRDAGAIVLSALAAALLVFLITQGETESFRYRWSSGTVEQPVGDESPGSAMRDAYREAFEGYSPWYLVLVPLQLGWFLLELLTMLANDKRRAFHDFIGGTVVVKVQPGSAPSQPRLQSPAL